MTDICYKRERSLLTGEKVKHLFTIKDFPVYMGCVTTPQEDDLAADMVFNICPQTGFIQLEHIPHLKYLYLTGHNDAIGKTWNELFEVMTKTVDKYVLYDTNCLEIGGGSGKMAIKIVEKIDKISQYLIYEPNSLNSLEKYPKITLVPEYFTKDTHLEEPPNMVIHSHVLEHCFNPNDFITTISQKISPGGLHIFAVPNLIKMLSLKYTNCLNFEHSFLIAEDYIDIILTNCGFTILEKSYFKDHSIIYVTKKVQEYSKLSYPNLSVKHSTLFFDFINYYQKFIEETNQRLTTVSKKVFLFGGHIFSQFLFKFGLNTEKIECIIDNSPFKKNKRLYGTTLRIHHPSIIEDYSTPIIILKAGTYQEEIKTQLLLLNNSAKIWE